MLAFPPPQPTCHAGLGRGNMPRRVREGNMPHRVREGNMPRRVRKGEICPTGLGWGKHAPHGWEEGNMHWLG